MVRLHSKKVAIIPGAGHGNSGLSTGFLFPGRDPACVRERYECCKWQYNSTTIGIHSVAVAASPDFGAAGTQRRAPFGDDKSLDSFLSFVLSVSEAI